jgi:hypothetical protein
MFKILGLILILIVILDLVINGGGIWKAIVSGVKSLFGKAKDKLDGDDD